MSRWADDTLQASEVSDETLGTGTFSVVVKGVYLGTHVALKIEDINDAKEKAYKQLQVSCY